MHNRGGYNRTALIFSWRKVAWLAVAALAAQGVAQVRTAPLPVAKTIVVLPFENASKAPGLEWIRESVPEVLGQRLASAAMYVVSRDNRALAFDRAGIPGNVPLSRATLFRIAEQMDVDYVVLGRFNFDGQTFTATAQSLDMRGLRLSPEFSQSGPLVKLIEVQTALAWDLLRQVRPEALPSREQFLAAAPPIRLDAFENYVRGVMSAEQELKVKHFREAIRLNPDYTMAMLQLAHTYFKGRDYEQAEAWYARIPRGDPSAREASFYRGLAAYALGDFARAEEAFGFVASRMPLTEVYNNLGVVAGRRGKRSEVEYLQKAVKADPNDPDYRFNLAVALYRVGDAGAASRQLREALALNPSDADAKGLLEAIASNVGRSPEQRAASGAHLPAERLKRNYDETSFQQLALEIQNATEMRLSKTDPATHAEYHVERGRDLLAQGFKSEAGREFREAVLLNPANAAAHAGLARVLEDSNDVSGARSEAQSALQLQPSADALLVLARLDLKANQPQSAQQRVDQALALEPNNATAIAMKRTLTESLSGAPR